MKALNKLIFVITALALVITAPLKTNALEESEYTVPSVSSYILSDAATGKVLIQHNAGKKIPMASITKIMLLLLLADDLNSGKVSLKDNVPVSAYASGMTGSVIWLEPGEIMSLSDLVKAIVISSANDAAVTVAEFLEESEEAFVKRMNKRAAELGMRNTNFTNVVGYDEKEHYTTAYDAALMTAELFKNNNYEYYSEFMQTRLSSVRTGTERETQLLNTNKLTNSYDGLLGGKTGTTDGAGYCVAECAERGEFRLISIVLGAKSDDDRISLSKYLLDTGFSEYQMFTPEMDYIRLQPVKVDGGVNKTVDIEPAKLPRCVIPKGSGSKITYEYNISESIEAPLKKGTVVGNVTAYLGNDIVFMSDVLAAEDVEKLTFIKSFSILASYFFKF